MRVAEAQSGQKLGEVRTRATPKDFKEGISALRSLAEEIAEGKKIGKVSGCVPGTFNRDRRTIFRSPNLSDWEGKPLLSSLEAAFGTQILLDNDAALAGLGEAHFGSGRGFRTVMYLTISTGVGGARIVNGRIDENAFGYEPGKQILDFKDGSTLESLISGGAFMKRFHRNPQEVPTIDPLWRELAETLAHGLHNSIVHWSPDAIVLGGAMVLGNPFIPISAVESELAKTLAMYPEIPAIRKSSLGDHSGLYGAIERLKS